MLRRHISFGFHKPLTYLIIEVGIFSAYLTGVPNPDTPAFAVLARCDVSDICDFELLPIVPDNPQWHEFPIRAKVGHYFDILLTYSRCPIRTGYIAKKEMEKIPLLSTWMRYLHCLFLDRKDIKQGLKTILTAVDKVKSGISICIFPEGTRNRNKDELDMLPFHEGSFKIATKANCPIIPIAISNSANIFEAHFPKISPAKVVVEYGKPIYPDELSKEDKRHVGEYTQNVIREMLIKNKPLTEK